MSETIEKKTGLELMREPFLPNQISKLPKPTKAQTDEIKADFKKGVRCEICGGWHHPNVVHLDYVGHAALTDRLLDVDPNWSWEPLACGPDGYPVIDKDGGGLWIKLTVCGVTRLGYGDAQGKSGGDAMKERIGDALRNAAMRFGAALDLWHKGDLHVDDDTTVNKTTTQNKPVDRPSSTTPADGMPKVNQALHDELAAYCVGDTAKMDLVCRRITHYEADGKEYSFGIDRLPKASEKWAGKALTALKKMVAAESEAADIEADKELCPDCQAPLINGHCSVCPF